MIEFLAGIFMLIILASFSAAAILGLLWLTGQILDAACKYWTGDNLSYAFKKLKIKLKDNQREKISKGWFGLGNLGKETFCPFCGSPKCGPDQWGCGTRATSNYWDVFEKNPWSIWLDKKDVIPGCKLPPEVELIRSNCCKRIMQLKMLLANKKD